MKRLLFVGILLSLGACKDAKRYHDEGGASTSNIKGSESVSFLEDNRSFRQDRDRYFGNPESSPLLEKDFIVFKRLDYFPMDSSYRVKAKLAVFPKVLPSPLPATDGSSGTEEAYGELVFSLNDTTHRLLVFRDPVLSLKPGFEKYLFLPFGDATNGTETYSGGRYLDLEVPQTDSLWVDFNKAYNPTCVYNPKFVCPLVPPSNILSVPVRAGELMWESTISD